MKTLAACLAAALTVLPALPAGADEPEDVRIERRGGAEVLLLGKGGVPGLRWQRLGAVETSGALRASGLVNYDPRRVATIVSRVQGRIEDVRMSLWDSVDKGDRIVELYSPDFMTAEAEYLQASSASAGGRLDGMSDAIVEASKLKLSLLGMAPEDLKGLTAPQSTIWMRAPIGGTVLDDKVVRGSAVNPGDVLFTLGTLDEVWITADVYEEDAPRLQVGQRLEAQVAAYPGRVFTGTVSNISPDINPDTHTLQVRSKVANPDGILKPRMLASVTLLTRAGTSLSVPQDALIFDTEGYYVFVKAPGGGVLRRRVEVASWSSGGSVRLRSGLKAGEEFAASETIQLNALWHRAKGEGT